jgi:hypothetical protein
MFSSIVKTIIKPSKKQYLANSFLKSCVGCYPTLIDIPKPVWAVGFALEQTLHVVALTVFSYVDFKVDSA